MRERMTVDLYDELKSVPRFTLAELDALFEPQCCSICDGMGHGYPGGGPCPTEELPWYVAMKEANAAEAYAGRYGLDPRDV